MHVIERSFFNLGIVKAALPELIDEFSKVSALSVRPKKTKLVFPEQPYAAGPTDLPMVLWSPACAPQLTAFMPHVSSGDYFVLEYACKRFGYSAASARSTTQMDEWPINEFIAYEGKEKRRIVRAMKDSPRWEFYANGEPLPFEIQSAYNARLVRDRLRREMLLSYLTHWGAPVLQPGFWRSDQDAITLA